MWLYSTTSSHLNNPIRIINNNNNKPIISKIPDLVLFFLPPSLMKVILVEMYFKAKVVVSKDKVCTQ